MIICAPLVENKISNPCIIKFLVLNNQTAVNRMHMLDIKGAYKCLLYLGYGHVAV